MNKMIKSRFFLALGIAFMLVACNGSGGDEKSKGDSTSTTKPDSSKATASDDAMDASKVAPGMYKIIKDTMGIRVLEVTYKPGDSSAMHFHPDYGIYVATDCSAEFTGKDGKKNLVEMKAGTIMVKPAETHSVKNVGKTPLKVILFEVRRSGAVTPMDAAMDVAKVSAAEYKVKADTMGIRMMEVNYKPGESSAMHGHPDLALYVLSTGTMELTEKDGKKATNEMKEGAALIRPATTHSSKNVGKTAMKAIMVEVSRAMK